MTDDEVADYVRYLQAHLPAAPRHPWRQSLDRYPWPRCLVAHRHGSRSRALDARPARDNGSKIIAARQVRQTTMRRF